MEPPPAPTVTISITGVLTGRPSIFVIGARSGTPSEMSETSVLVPPISRVMRSRTPDAPTWRSAPTTPAAGPENRAAIAFRAIASAGIRPPFDCMTLKRPSKPFSANVVTNRPR